MEAVMYLDTHVVAWLYSGETDRLPEVAREAIEKHNLLISPAVVLELRYLYETGRILEDAGPIVERLIATIGLAVVDRGFLHVVQEAVRQDWTRDPFDRLIVAQAIMDKSLLLTKDREMRKHYTLAFWDSLAKVRAGGTLPAS